MHYCITVTLVRLALASALIALKRTTPPWRRSFRLVGLSKMSRALSEAHGATRD
uniref:RxLR effector candidate protein n=1 Tax=Hyaloperonospora arabidopsidis (strain Emoy2) TaxID=559515 RepID=M4B365_HYAAE